MSIRHHQRQSNQEQERKAQLEEEREKEESEVIISGLGTETIRWINNRRPKVTAAKVALTFHHEKLLRELFNHFDYNDSGVVSLEELSQGLNYVEKSPHFHSMLYILRNLRKSFLAMDIDGGGEVDFNEFCIGMSTGRGPLDDLSKTGMKIALCCINLLCYMVLH